MTFLNDLRIGILNSRFAENAKLVVWTLIRQSFAEKIWLHDFGQL